MDLIRPDWPAPARVKALITTRAGGSSLAPYDTFNLGLHVGDQTERVLRNRAALRQRLPAEPCWMRQVHGTAVADADASPPEPECDAAVSYAAGRVLAVLSADCLPVLLCDRQGTAVAVAHAGWRGLAAGVLEATVSRLGLAPCALLAFLGPAIGPGAYEVRDDVRDAFVAGDPEAAGAFRPARQGRYLADLYALARRRLANLGLEAVYGGRCCTYSEPARFFSYRRDGATGRFASLVWLAS
ncbi:MAG: peptidoglycan editing factor PgeF [Burkholderiales bacterium]|nr:peptidoglycan editing factor PgeF [Burkholderiales bacterium]